MKKQNVLDVLIVGAGQSGLASAYYIKQRKLSFLLVDAHKRIGDSWRKRYDSLHLLTPDSENSLPGLALKGTDSTYATKNVYANYLKSYATHFSFPVELGVHIDSLKHVRSLFVAKSKKKTYQAKNVVIATGPFQKAYIPKIAQNVASTVFQLHSDIYKNILQVLQGSVLVVGAGNSGAQIASELSRVRNVTLSSKRKIIFTNRLDFLYTIAAFLLGAQILRRITNLFSVRKVFVDDLEYLLKNKRILLKPELVKFSGRRAFFKDGSSMEYDTLIWATGFKPDFNWINIPGAFDKKGDPTLENGQSIIQGLFFVYPKRDFGFIRDLAPRVRKLIDSIKIL